MLSFKSKNVFVIRSIKYRHVLVYRCWGLLFISRNKLTLVCIWSYCGESLVIFFLLRLFQENVIFHSDFMTRFVVRTQFYHCHFRLLQAGVIALLSSHYFLSFSVENRVSLPF